jgi:hypothetical protein
MVSNIARESTRPRTKKVSSQQQQQQQVQKQKNAYQNFIEAIDNEYTKRNYEMHFEEFRQAMKLSESCNELLEMEDSREFEDAIVNYIKGLSARGASTASMRLKLAAIRRFYVENRAETRLNWGWLKARVPKGRGIVKDRDYLKEELVKMWEQGDIRKKAILALLMSGLRKGAIPSLRVGNLARITEYRDNSRERNLHKLEGYHIYKLVVYEGDPEEYCTFVTPSGAKAIDRYLESRTTAGEKITAHSPLIRDAFDSMNAKDPKPLTPNALHMVFTRLTRSSGIRPKEKKEGTRQSRHDVMLFHGIRKYCNHAFLDSGVDVVAKELMLGHAAPGLEGSYLRLTENELLSQFVRAISALSLSQESELKQQVDQLRIEVADMNALKAYQMQLEQRLREEQEFKRLLAHELTLQKEVVDELRALVNEKLREREKKKRE